jgi:hypothetical protein
LVKQTRDAMREPVEAGRRQIFLGLLSDVAAPTWFSVTWLALFFATAGAAEMIAADRMLKVIARILLLPIDIP